MTKSLDGVETDPHKAKEEKDAAGAIGFGTEITTHVPEENRVKYSDGIEGDSADQQQNAKRVWHLLPFRTEIQVLQHKEGDECASE